MEYDSAYDPRLSILAIDVAIVAIVLPPAITPERLLFEQFDAFNCSNLHCYVCTIQTDLTQLNQVTQLLYWNLD